MDAKLLLKVYVIRDFLLDDLVDIIFPHKLESHFVNIHKITSWGFDWVSIESTDQEGRSGVLTVSDLLMHDHGLSLHLLVL